MIIVATVAECEGTVAVKVSRSQLQELGPELRINNITNQYKEMIIVRYHTRLLFVVKYVYSLLSIHLRSQYIVECYGYVIHPTAENATDCCLVMKKYTSSLRKLINSKNSINKVKTHW